MCGVVSGDVGKEFFDEETAFQKLALQRKIRDLRKELGKVLAGNIRKEMASRNQDSAHSLDSIDPITRFYMEMLFVKD